MKTPMQRFLEKTNKRGPRSKHGRCWVWQGTNNGRYGKMYFEGKNVFAHRFIFEQTKGLIEKGKVIDHLCRNRLCVNPAHLEQKTNRENLMAEGSRIRFNGQNMRDKTHCEFGHPFDEVNTKIVKTKGRQFRRCRTCANLQQRQYEIRKRRKQCPTLRS